MHLHSLETERLKPVSSSKSQSFTSEWEPTLMLQGALLRGTLLPHRTEGHPQIRNFPPDAAFVGGRMLQLIHGSDRVFLK